MEQKVIYKKPIEKQCKNCKEWRWGINNEGLCNKCIKERNIRKKEDMYILIKNSLKNPIFYNLYGHIISDGSLTPMGNIIYSNNRVELIKEVQKEFKILYSI